MKNVQLTLTFYKPPRDDPWINRMVAFFDGPFSHVEISFSDGMSSSIFAGETVFMHKRTLANPNYTLVTIPVTEQQAGLAREFCLEQASRCVSFDGWGMYASFLVPSIASGCIVARKHQQQQAAAAAAESTFCSKHVVMALQHAGVEGFEHLLPWKATPSAIYKAVQRAYAGTTVAATTAYRLQRLYDSL